MNYKLIADAGSTKTNWSLIAPDNSVTSYNTVGLNALLASEQDMEHAFAGMAARLPEGVDLTEVIYYGAGCASPEICTKTEQALQQAFAADKVTAVSDLVGAARSLLGSRRGIACILGTGSNSCLYDGSDIVSNVPSLGFILGDEGSGAALGKRLVGDAFKGQLPELVKRRFLETYGLSAIDILDNVYRKPSPNRFLASLVPFISENLWNPYIYSLVRQEFTAFITRNVMLYPQAHSLPICFTGSIAYHFREILTETCSAMNLSIGVITDDPMPGLVEYHKNSSSAQ